MPVLEIYLDKAFIDHFREKSGMYEHSTFMNFKRFWNVIKNFRLITNYSMLEWENELITGNEFIKNIYSAGHNPIVLYDNDFSNSFEAMITIGNNSPFILCFSDSFSSEVINAFGFENINSDNFNDKWIKYDSITDSAMKVTNRQFLEKENRFDSWDCLDRFSHPVNSILINDSYILNDRQNNRIRDNLIPLLKKLLQHGSTKIPVEIIIFADPTSMHLDYKKIYKQISIILLPILQTKSCPL